MLHLAAEVGQPRALHFAFELHFSCSAHYLMPFQLIQVVLLLVVHSAAEVLVDATCDTRAGLEPAEAALGPDKIYAANSALVSVD